MQGLTERQQQILNAIAGYISEKGYSPTVREIADMVGLSHCPQCTHICRGLRKKVISQKKKENQGLSW